MTDLTDDYSARRIDDGSFTLGKRTLVTGKCEELLECGIRIPHERPGDGDLCGGNSPQRALSWLLNNRIDNISAPFSGHAQDDLYVESRFRFPI